MSAVVLVLHTSAGLEHSAFSLHGPLTSPTLEPEEICPVQNHLGLWKLFLQGHWEALFQPSLLLSTESQPHLQSSVEVQRVEMGLQQALEL